MRSSKIVCFKLRFRGNCVIGVDKFHVFHKGLSNEDEVEDKIIGEVAKKQKAKI